MKKTIISISLLLLFFLPNFSFAQEKVWTADWVELRTRPYPQWFKDAKLGIFIHWGLYSVPAYGGAESYGEWYLRGLQMDSPLRVDFMKNNFGDDFTYRDFAPLFKAELFDPYEWADIFSRAGAKYIILVTKHHDGYCLWPSQYAPGWNSMDVGPNRDLVGELSEAIKKRDIRLGLYYSLTEWNNPLHRWYTDPNDQIGEYVEKYMYPQFKELISTYKPDLIFTDGEWYNKADDFKAADLISWYYNLVGEDAIINNRWGGGSNIGFLTPEYSSGLKKSDRPWAEVRGLGRSFGLNRNEKLEAYMSAEELIHFFVKAVSNGGGITINVGPKADGQIPLLQQERIIQLGDWIKINEEAIYGSTAWIRSGEEKDYKLTRIDPVIDFSWVRNTPGQAISEDNFSATWTGFLRPDHSDEFTFEAIADDAVRVWVDNQLIINNWKNVPEGVNSQAMDVNLTQASTGTLGLQSDKFYPIRVEYYENKLNASVQLFWSSGQIEKELIPEEYFFTSDIFSLQKAGLNACYRSKGQYLAYTVNHENLYVISLEWPGDKLILPIKAPADETIITMLGVDTVLPWQYTGGNLEIDLSQLGLNILPSFIAWTIKIENYLTN